MLLVAIYNPKKGIVIKYQHEFKLPITFDQTRGCIWKVFMRQDVMISPYFAIYNDKEIIVTPILPVADEKVWKDKGYSLANISKQCYPYFNFESFKNYSKAFDGDLKTPQEIQLAALTSIQFYTDIETMLSKELNQFPDHD